jgi:glycerophosphoryl diester phosphodiesterase
MLGGASAAYGAAPVAPAASAVPSASVALSEPSEPSEPPGQAEPSEPVEPLEPLEPQETIAQSVEASDSAHIMLIAHRGSARDLPEHSIAGYRLAISQGSIFLEPDLVVSKDGVIYVCHDRNLKKTTGKDIDITKTSSKKLDKVKLKNGENLHRLSEIFREFGDSVFYVAETKDIGGKAARRMDRALVKLIKKYGLRERVMLQSQSVESLSYVHKSLKSIPCMYISEKDTRSELTEKLKTLPKWIGVVSISRDKITDKMMKLAHKRDRKVALYTVTGRKSMEQALARGPDMIFTDNVKLSLKCIAEWK